jgi:two-component system, chemotaxis family, CheB/CheR fusion protein
VKRSAAKAKSRNRVPALACSAGATPFPIVGVGASAGGLEAFSELLRQLPEKTGMAFVLVQHLDPKHTSGLREILARTTKIPVVEVSDGTVVKPDYIYVIPPNTSMTIKAGALRLSPRVLSRGQHLPIDHFLRSLANDRGNQAISVVLSGTASDGTEGSHAIKACGGITFAQDEKSARYASMPHSAVHAGCVDFVLPPAAIAKELVRVARHPYLVPALDRADLDITVGNHMGTILSLLREATGVDFTHYKQTTLHRRINRRMVLHKVEKLKDYVRLVRNTPGEIEELYQDILIHVTGFFRDPQAFEALRQHVFPDLLGDSKKTGTVRVWVPGCSTGEEVYSLAMAMLEYLWLETTKTAKNTLGGAPFQIFATDISDTSLDRARAGLYADALMVNVSPERLRRFFVRLDGGYQIAKAVREMCIFAKQNVAKDPPFSNLDLVSCRNLLIYLGPVLQKRVVPSLHYALKPSGYLMLGEAESLGTFSEYFTPVDKKNKIYKKKESASRLVTYFGSVDYGLRRSSEGKAGREPKPVSTIEKEADRMLMDRFVPASIVVNEQMEIVQFRGKTGPYLEPAAGQPTFSLSKMAREGLLVDLRAALGRARKDNATVRREGVRVQSNGHTRQVNLEVSPMQGTGPGERFYLVVFQDAASAAKSPRKREKTPTAKDTASRETARLQRELAQIREQFQTLIEEHETVSEEFKSANEEVLSANEELQSANEELETAKEELQSSNEELTTLNEELQNRNTELTAVNNDLLNLLSNVTIPVVIVGQDLHIRRFTPPAQKLLNLLPSDVGRRLSEIRPNLDVEDLGQFARESIDNVSSLEREVRENSTGVWYQMRVRPYKTWDSKIDGAVLSFQDVDAMKRDLDRMHQHADALIENAREAILVLDGKLQVVSANLAFCQQFEVSRQETQNRAIYELGDGQWNIPKLRELLENILPNNGRVEDFEVRHEFPRLGERRMMLNAGRIEPQAGQKMILLYIEDVTGNA